MTLDYVPHPGDIGLTQIKGHVGRLVRVGIWLNGDGRHNYQHAFVYVGNDKLVEAEPGGARLSLLGRYELSSILWLKCPPQHRKSVAAAAMAMRGIPYSWADYGALALHRFHIPTPRLKRYIESGGSMICSQLCDRAAELGGWHIFDDRRWHGDVTPGDLARAAWAQQRMDVL